MIVWAIITDVLGMKTYCYAGGIGMLVDYFNILTVLIGGMMLDARRQYKLAENEIQEEPQKKPTDDSKPLLGMKNVNKEDWVPSFTPLSSGPRSWSWHIFQFLLKQSLFLHIILVRYLAFIFHLG